MTTRIACVLADNLPTQVEGQKRGAGTPIIISHPVESTAVFAMTDDVANAGVQIGMSLYQARQIVPAALVIEPDEMTYHALHGAIHAALTAFTPVIETVGLGEFLMDVRAPSAGSGQGLERLHGSEHALAEAMSSAARAASGLTICVGLATGKFIAQQAARQAPANGVVVVPPVGREFLAPLPLTVLPNLPGEIRRRLMLFDIHTLGDLAALGKAAVLRQFSGEMASLYELARGNDPRPLNPDMPPLRLVRSMRMKEAVSDRQILFNVAQRLSWQLSKALTAKGYHAEALKLALADKTGQWLEAGQAVKPPTSDEARLGRLAAQLLGRLPTLPPVENVALSAYPLRPWHLGQHQMALIQAGVPQKQTRLEEVLQLLYHRFGQAVVRIAALLGPPVPLKVDVALNPDGLPGRLIFGGATRVVLGIDEHWREERLWWDLRPVRRDYFRVILADGSLRNIFQNLLDGEWYLDRAWPLL